MKKSQSGFTLIELVVVIVLLGILGVTALGKFQDLSGKAEVAALDGVVAELSSASAVNYAASVLGTGTTTDLTVANICTDAILDSLFATGSIPTGYAISGTGNCLAAAAGDSVSCTVEQSKPDGTAGATKTASLICTE